MKTRIKWMQFYLWCFIIGLSIGMLTGCSTTVTPVKVSPAQASFDQSFKPDAKPGQMEQNSGFIAFNEDGSGLITPHARERYNGLVATYGNRFLPPLSKDAGITPQGDVFRIDAEHLVKFVTMNRWRKEGK